MRSWLRRKSLLVHFSVYGAIAIAAVLVYAPGLDGPFVFDDISNITHNPAIRLSSLDPSSLYATAANSSSGAFGRPFAMLSIAVDFFIAKGLSNTFVFKLTNLVIHLINIGLVYWFILLVQKQIDNKNPTSTFMPWLPGLAAALWALHPLNLTSVLYVVQRMTSLSALFVLAGTIMFFIGRQRIHEQKRHGITLMVGGWFTGLVIGMSAKENAVLMLLYIPLIEFLFFQRADFHTPAGTRLRAFYVFAIALPLLMILAWVLIHPQLVYRGYGIRDFDMAERMLTEPRVLWFYLYLLFFPDITHFGLYHDDIPVSTDALTPWTTLPALLALLFLAFAAFLWRKKYPVFSFAVLWFLAGHCLESSFLPLELAHEHRNYLPAIGPVLGITYALDAAMHNRNRMYPTLCVAIVAALASITLLRAQAWATEEMLITSMARHHPRSASTQAILAEFYAKKKGDLIRAQQHYEIAMALEPNEIGHILRMLMNIAKLSADNNPPISGKSNSKARGSINDLRITDQLLDHLKTNFSSKPLTATTILALDDLSNCVSKPPFSCRDLYPYARKWYRWTLENPNVLRDMHKSILIYLFEISTSQEDYSDALDTAKKARSFDPNDISFMLMEADARIALQQFGQAEEILFHVKNGLNTNSADTMNGIDTLLAKIRKARATSHMHRSSDYRANSN